jgi:hypothetical protein
VQNLFLELPPTFESFITFLFGLLVVGFVLEFDYVFLELLKDISSSRPIVRVTSFLSIFKSFSLRHLPFLLFKFSIPIKEIARFFLAVKRVEILSQSRLHHNLTFGDKELMQTKTLDEVGF